MRENYTHGLELDRSPFFTRLTSLHLPGGPPKWVGSFPRPQALSLGSCTIETPKSLHKQARVLCSRPFAQIHFTGSASPRQGAAAGPALIISCGHDQVKPKVNGAALSACPRSPLTAPTRQLWSSRHADSMSIKGPFQSGGLFARGEPAAPGSQPPPVLTPIGGREVYFTARSLPRGSHNWHRGEYAELPAKLPLLFLLVNIN